MSKLPRAITSAVLLWTVAGCAKTDANGGTEPPPVVMKYVAADSGLVVRSTPSPQGARAGGVPFAAEVRVLEVTGDDLTIQGAVGKWTMVSHDRTTGWVFGGFLSDDRSSLARSLEFHARHLARTKGKPASSIKKDVKSNVALLGVYEPMPPEGESLNYHLYCRDQGGWIPGSLGIEVGPGYHFKDIDGDGTEDVVTAGGCCGFLSVAVLLIEDCKANRVYRVEGEDYDGQPLPEIVSVGRCDKTKIRANGKVVTFDCKTKKLY